MERILVSVLSVVCFLIFLGVNVNAKERYFPINKGDILIWHANDFRAKLVRKFHPNLSDAWHADVVGTDWQGMETPLICATHRGIPDIEPFRARMDSFIGFTIMRPYASKHMILKKAQMVVGVYGDLEGFLTGLDLLFSGGKKFTFRRYTRKYHLTCISYVATILEYDLPHLVLPIDLLESTQLTNVGYFKL